MVAIEELKTTYLDNAATTYPKPESVYQAMDYANRHLAVNAGRGSYNLAKKATALIDETREKGLNLVKGADIARLIFAPSATVALNIIIGGIKWNNSDICYVSPFEHNAVMRPLHRVCKKYGFKIVELPLDEKFIEIDIEKMKYMFSVNPPTWVFMTHISNVTGYILPIDEIITAAKEHEAKVVVDASQSLGLLDIDMRRQNMDFLVFAGHKNLYGPFGIGGFFVRNGVKIDTYISGGTGSDSLNLEMPSSIPLKFEPASPNIVAVAGMNQALRELEKEGKTRKSIKECQSEHEADKDNSNIEAKIEYDLERQKMDKNGYFIQEKKLTEYLVERLKNIKNAILYLPKNQRHIGIVSFNIKGYKASDVGMILDEDYNVAVRTGYHCSPLIHKHLKDTEYGGVVRASIGRFTTKDDVDILIDAVGELSEEV